MVVVKEYSVDNQYVRSVNGMDKHALVTYEQLRKCAVERINADTYHNTDRIITINESFSSNGITLIVYYAK